MPRTRSASLRVAHARACPNASKSALDSTGNRSGCECQPSYYTQHRDAAGRPVKGPRVRDRRTAERGLRKLLVEIDEGRVGVGSPKRGTMTVAQWCDLYLDRLEGVRAKTVKPSTVAAYRSTIRTYVKPTLGRLPLDEVGTKDLDRFVLAIRETRGSEMTLHKHLRHLGAVLRAAERRKPPLLDRSPLDAVYIEEVGVEKVGGVEPYTDGELARLLLALKNANRAPVYLLVVRAAVTTGARIGELAALSWGDVNLGNRTVSIGRSYDSRYGIGTTKTGTRRVVNLIPAAIKVFEDVVAELGDGPDDAPVFPAPRSRDRLDARWLNKIVTEAIADAGIPTVGEHGRSHKPLHSLRATFTRIALEAGQDPIWVQRQIGHATLDLTVNTYGKWSHEASAAEAAKLDRFPV